MCTLYRMPQCRGTLETSGYITSQGMLVKNGKLKVELLEAISHSEMSSTYKTKRNGLKGNAFSSKTSS